MPGLAARHRHRTLRVRPAVPRHLVVRSAVVHLPEGQGVGAVVELELLVKIAIHGMNHQRVPLGHHRRGAKEGLLLRVGMLRGKGVVLADNADGGVNAIAGFHNFIRQAGAVAVADHIRAPFFRKLQGQLLIASLSGKGKTALAVLLLHCSFLHTRYVCRSVRSAAF